MRRLAPGPFSVSILLLALSACGGGGGGGSDPTPPSSDTPTVNVSIDSGQTNLDLAAGEYQLVTSEASVPLAEQGAQPTTVETKETGTSVVVLSDENGEPVLVARKLEGAETVEVSVESSAEVFVLMNARFFGLKITNQEELSSRIRGHQAFSSLVEQLEKNIADGSPCPLDPNCSFIASMTADDIASEVELSDIVEK